MKSMSLKLSSAGNPDFGQSPQVSCSPEETCEVDSYRQASKVSRKYIHKYNLGGGNWTGGQLFKNGIQVAYVSYNGRVWSRNNKLIYNPSNDGGN